LKVQETRFIFPVQESRMSDTGVLHEVNAYDYFVTLLQDSRK